MKEQKGVFPTKGELILYFEQSLFRESSSFTPIQYDRRKEQGTTMLNEYYDQYINGFSKDVEIEFKVPRMMLDGVPVTGKIDKIEIEADGCTVVDYKTGDPDRSATAMVASPNDKEPSGGDYWRQMVFYKLLLENYPDRPFRVKMGMFDYIEKGRKSNEYKRLYVPVYTQDEEIVREQLKDSYLRIMNHDFNTGCGDEDCHWCNFAKQYELIRPTEEVEVDDI
jgi:DNA helicase-2/ATP-dependent DNA helicase PcrA